MELPESKSFTTEDSIDEPSSPAEISDDDDESLVSEVKTDATSTTTTTVSTGQTQSEPPTPKIDVRSPLDLSPPRTDPLPRINDQSPRETTNTFTTIITEEISPIITEEEPPKPLLSHVHYYKEGTLQLRTLKSWKEFFFIVKNGLLLYFENERVTTMGITYN